MFDSRIGSDWNFVAQILCQMFMFKSIYFSFEFTINYLYLFVKLKIKIKMRSYIKSSTFDSSFMLAVVLWHQVVLTHTNWPYRKQPWLNWSNIDWFLCRFSFCRRLKEWRKEQPRLKVCFSWTYLHCKEEVKWMKLHLVTLEGWAFWDRIAWHHWDFYWSS